MDQRKHNKENHPIINKTKELRNIKDLLNNLNEKIMKIDETKFKNEKKISNSKKILRSKTPKRVVKSMNLIPENKEELNNSFKINKNVKKNVKNESMNDQEPNLLFETKIFKKPELIFKNLGGITNQIIDEKINIVKKLHIKPPLGKNKANEIILNNEEIEKRNEVIKIYFKINMIFQKTNDLEEVENRIKDLHLKTEDALMNFVSIRENLLKINRTQPKVYYTISF